MEESHNPFVGLRPFEMEESLLFFGRKEQTLELLQRLHQHHFVAVVGTSGCGKSSLLRAGLIPALHGGYLVNDCSKWLISIMKPGTSPLFYLTKAILQHTETEPTDAAAIELIARIKEEGADAILQVLAPVMKDSGVNFFLLIDQFEELFRFAMTQNDQEAKDEAIDFINIILELCEQETLPFYIVLTMRSDFIGDCTQFYGLPEALNKSQYLVPRLTRQQTKMAIEGPAKLYGIKPSSALTSLLLNRSHTLKDELPLLQHALLRIWDFEINEDGNGELDVNDYEKIGGLESALSLHANEAMIRMSEADELLTSEIFKALTAVDENGRKIRRPVSLSYLVEMTGRSEAEIIHIIDLFIEGGRSFLIKNSLDENQEMIIDISHESLIRQWDRLDHWVEEEHDASSFYMQLAEATRLHKRGMKDLLVGSELQVGIDWVKRVKPTAVWANRYAEGFEEAIAYLEKSEATERLTKRADKRRRRKFRVLTFSTLILAVAFSVYALFAQQKSLRLKNESLKLQAELLQLQEEMRMNEQEEHEAELALQKIQMEIDEISARSQLEKERMKQETDRLMKERERVERQLNVLEEKEERLQIQSQKVHTYLDK